MTHRSMLRATLGAALAFMFSAAQAAIVAGHVDDFEDGTTQGWTINLLGTGTPPTVALPVNVASGGPAGVDDNYLRLTSIGGAGGGSRLVGINVGAAWTGDYAAAGITGIRLQARNFGVSDLSLRLRLANPVSGPPTDAAISDDALLLPAGGDWTTLEFSLLPADLLALQGSIGSLLGNVTDLRLFHSATDQFPGSPIAATLGVDNITALAGTLPPPPGVPEPTSALLTAVALLGLAVARRLR